MKTNYQWSYTITRLMFHCILRLLESGRINAKKVLVITNLDNRHHIDIVLAFNKYLKVNTIWKVYLAGALTNCWIINNICYTISQIDPLWSRRNDLCPRYWNRDCLATRPRSMEMGSGYCRYHWKGRWTFSVYWWSTHRNGDNNIQRFSEQSSFY